MSIFGDPLALSIIVGLPLFGAISKFFGISFQRIAKWYLYITVFAVLIVMNSIFFPFIGGKDYFFRFATELSLICLLLWWAFEAKTGEFMALIRKNKKPLAIAVSIFVVIFVLACLFALDAHAAFWSNYERGEGGFQMLHYYLFFVLLVLLLPKEEDWKNLFKFSLCASGIMIIYGLFANFGTTGFISPYSGTTAPTGWWHQLIDGRFEGSLGNPAYVDPYLIFSMFYAAYLWIRAKAEGTATKLVSWGYGVLIAIFFIFFILGQTRGAFLGLAGGIFVMVLYLIFSKSASMGLRKWSAIIMGILVVLGIVGYSIRNIPAVQNLPEGRLLQISASDASAQTRLWVWAEAWQGFLERPILGWGPENFTAVYDKFFNPNFFVPGQSTETWFDRAHSVYLDYLSETGIFGLLSYLAIFVAFYWEFFKKHRRGLGEGQVSNTHALERGLMLGVPVAYLIQGIAIFDVLPIYISLFLFLAFAHYYFYEKHGQNS